MRYSTRKLEPAPDIPRVMINQCILDSFSIFFIISLAKENGKAHRPAKPDRFLQFPGPASNTPFPHCLPPPPPAPLINIRPGNYFIRSGNYSHTAVVKIYPTNMITNWQQNEQAVPHVLHMYFLWILLQFSVISLSIINI